MWLSWCVCACLGGDMGVAVPVRVLAGVFCRTLRKRSSLTLILVLSSSLCLLRSARNLENVKERAMVEKEEDGELITAKEVQDTLTMMEEAVTTVEAPCKRMALFGGVLTCSCSEKKCARDGGKFVCLDPDVMPPPRSCLALNFGIGYEFSFDEALANYGCRVIALDPTNSNVTNRVHQANLTHSLPSLRLKGSRELLVSRRNIHALTLGLANKDYTMVLNLTTDSVGYRTNVAAYRTYRSLLRILDNPRVDLLKIDIEGNEWDVFQEILSSPDAPKLLQHVRQILMEVHFDFLKPSMKADEVLQGAWRAIAILRRLRDFGFRLAAADFNDTAQSYILFGSMKLALFREITLIRRGAAAV